MITTIVILSLIIISNRWDLMKLKDKIELLEMDFDDLNSDTKEEIKKLNDVVNPNSDLGL